ncbi:hypothetical protein K470DRAFT_255083 [Piedraia hortae CBS 480.64]|uniref:Uncharacterized protein n=1 Tax=Piedraia hortae CBS 480.64 TaxID=1314780 RepID=A0A6A7C815_9PEZI|nr:hypothetical protein K470DRAFT_255083 [Piedraia hortae CBS 480.64]
MANYRLPTVTEDDLIAFQYSHFGDDSVPINWFVDAATALGEDEDDGLGYYSDGTKRILTDTQVAMFRQKEVQELLKREETASQGAIAIGTLEGDAVKTLAKTARSKAKYRNDVPYEKRHKRKWEAYIQDQDPVEGSRTHRRIVRELDDQTSQEVEMDY